MIEINCDKDLFNKWIKTKNEEKNKIETEKLYRELDNQFNFNKLNINKQEVINKIKEVKLNKKKIKKWINLKIEEFQNNKARILYEELEDEFKLSEINFDKTEVINKIKEENFDKNKLIQWIESKLPKPMLELNPEVQKIFEELDEDFSISSIFEKDEVIKKIIELNCDREKLEKWIEDLM